MTDWAKVPWVNLPGVPIETEAWLRARLQIEEGMMELLDDLVKKRPPRRFALCDVVGDYEDAGLYAWGIQCPDTGAVTLDILNDRPRSYSSVDQALKYRGRVRNLRLVWIDEPQNPELMEDPADLTDPEPT